MCDGDGVQRGEWAVVVRRKRDGWMTYGEASAVARCLVHVCAAQLACW